MASGICNKQVQIFFLRVKLAIFLVGALRQSFPLKLKQDKFRNDSF